MEAAKPSRTAYRVALRRAVHQLIDNPKVFDDPLAIPIVGNDSASTAAQEERLATRSLRAFIAVRSRYAEEQLAIAVQDGVRQYVVLGAGLDTFAYRDSYPGLRVFEVDHPTTQQWKRERLQAAGIPIRPRLFSLLSISSVRPYRNVSAKRASMPASECLAPGSVSCPI
jgi:methyltransferase (TIGR00027 family)